MFIRALMLFALRAPDGNEGGAPPAPPPPAPGVFADQLPEDIRGEAAFRDIKDLGGLAKSYLSAQKMIGARPEDLVKLPGPEDADGWKAVYARLGRPEAPEKYEFKAPQGVTVDEGLKGQFSQAAFEHGLSAKQAAGLFDWWNNTAGSIRTAADQAEQTRLTQSTAALKAEWGPAFDQNLTLAKQAIDHFGGADLAQELDANKLGNSPKLAQMMAKMGKQLQEDGLIGRSQGGGTMLSPTEAKQQLAGLRSDPAFSKAYTDKNSAGHADAVKRMEGLYAIAYPGNR